MIPTATRDLLTSLSNAVLMSNLDGLKRLVSKRDSSLRREFFDGRREWKAESEIERESEERGRRREESDDHEIGKGRKVDFKGIED